MGAFRQGAVLGFLLVYQVFSFSLFADDNPTRRVPPADESLFWGFSVPLTGYALRSYETETWIPLPLFVPTIPVPLFIPLPIEVQGDEVLPNGSRWFKVGIRMDYRSRSPETLRHFTLTDGTFRFDMKDVRAVSYDHLSGIVRIDIEFERARALYFSFGLDRKLNSRVGVTLALSTRAGQAWFEGEKPRQIAAPRKFSVRAYPSKGLVWEVNSRRARNCSEQVFGLYPVE